MLKYLKFDFLYIKKHKYLLYQISIIRFFMSYVFIVFLFGVININRFTIYFVLEAI